MQLTAFAAWLNSAFGGYDRFFLRIMHSMAEALGVVLTPLMKIITLLGEKGLVLIVVSLVLMLFARTRKAGVCMFGAVACGAILTNFILKDWVARPRPFESMTVYRQWWEFVGSPAEDGFSFPSGHVTAAAAGLAALCLTRGRKWILPSAIWVLLMGVSRNYLMAHYPSDVLFAVLIGLLAAAIAYAITRLIFRLLEQHRDAPLCALLLDFDLPLRLPALRRADGLDGDEPEDGEDEDVKTAPARRTAVYADPERIDVSDAFDEIVREDRAARAARREGAVSDGDGDFSRPQHSSGAYRGKHVK